MNELCEQTITNAVYWGYACVNYDEAVCPKEIISTW